MYLWILLTLCLALPAPSFAQSSDAKGLAIAKEADRRDRGFSDTTADMTMILHSRQGNERTRKIASANQSGAFMGSEFAYEDMSSDEVGKYTYRYLGDDVIGGRAAYKVERYPRNRYSGYTRQVAWYDKDQYRILKIDYYDRKNVLLKTAINSDYRRYLGKYWRPLKVTMTNHQTGKRTRLLFDNLKFKNGLSGRDFDRSSLKRMR
jgi:outer membrane lipoprotein-sorting protein